jgi:hypothetical protein
MAFIMRSILLALIIFFIYLFLKTTLTQNRKFRHAVKQKRFYMIDTKNNVRKNLLLTLNGAVFEGEKHLDSNKNTNSVDTIYIRIRNPADLEGMVRKDFFFIEQKILKAYPGAQIHWDNPFYELMS